MQTFKKYTIIYFFNHSKMGFSNSITVISDNVDNAIKLAQSEVSGCYGSSMLKKFTFNPDPIKCGIVI